jgi:hypothetical protein
MKLRGLGRVWGFPKGPVALGDGFGFAGRDLCRDRIGGRNGR